MEFFNKILVSFQDIPLIGVFAKLLEGLPVTLSLVFPSVIIGALFAFVLALMRLSNNIILSSISRLYVFLFRSIPLLVLLFLVYYGIPQFRKTLSYWGIYWIFQSAYICAIIAFIMNTAAYGSEIIRGALLSVPHGQIEAGRACGMSRFMLMRRIIFPIAFRQALPGYSNEFILMVKSTALVSVVTLVDMTQIAIEMRSKIPLENSTVLYCVGALYLAINYSIAWIFKIIEYHFSSHLRDPNIVQTPPPLAQSL